MNFQFYLEKLYNSKEFQKFKSENPPAFLCSGFFSIDKLKNTDNQQHLDFYIPELNKMFSFKLLQEGQVEKIPVENFSPEKDNFNPTPIHDNYDFNFEEIEKLIQNKMIEEKVNKKIEKILLSLQSKSGKDFLVGTVFISGMGLIKILVDLNEMKITEFKKKSFFDMIRVVKKGD